MIGLIAAIFDRNGTTFTRILSENPELDLNISDVCPLHEATLANRPDMVRSLINYTTKTNKKVNVNMIDPTGKTPLMISCHNKKQDCFDLLLPLSDPNISDSEGYTALHFAAYQKSLYYAQKLLKSGAIVDPVIIQDGEERKNITPLYIALCERQDDMIALLVSYGADLDKKITFDDGQSITIRECVSPDYKHRFSLAVQKGLEVRQQPMLGLQS